MADLTALTVKNLQPQAKTLRTADGRGRDCTSSSSPAARSRGFSAS